MRQRLVNRNGKLHIDTTIENKRLRFSTGLIDNKENRQSVLTHFCDYVTDYLAQKGKIFKKSAVHVAGDGEASGEIATLERVGTKLPKKSKIRKLARQIAKTKNIDSITSMLQDFQTTQDEVIDNDIKLSDYTSLFLDYYTYLKPNTRTTMQTALKRLLKIFGDRIISTINSKDIEELQRELALRGYSKSTINITKLALNELLKLAYDDDVIKHIPQTTKKVKTKAQKRENNPFNLDEVKSILSLAKKIDLVTYCYLKIAFFTGARKGEILALKWKNIDFENNKIEIKATIGRYAEGTPKTSSSLRVIDMLPPVKDALMLLKEQRFRPIFYVFLKHENQVERFMFKLQKTTKKF